MLCNGKADPHPCGRRATPLGKAAVIHWQGSALAGYKSLAPSQMQQGWNDSLIANCRPVGLLISISCCRPSLSHVLSSKLHSFHKDCELLRSVFEPKTPAMRASRRDFAPRSSLVAALLATILLTSAHAAKLAKRDEINYFVNPPAAGPNADFNDNVNFNLGSIIDIGWVTDFDSVSLQLCQQNSDMTAACYPLFREQRNVASVQWTVGLGSSGFLLSSSQSKCEAASVGP